MYLEELQVEDFIDDSLEMEVERVMSQNFDFH